MAVVELERDSGKMGHDYGSTGQARVGGSLG